MWMPTKWDGVKASHYCTHFPTENFSILSKLSLGIFPCSSFNSPLDSSLRREDLLIGSPCAQAELNGSSCLLDTFLGPLEKELVPSSREKLEKAAAFECFFLIPRPAVSWCRIYGSIPWWPVLDSAFPSLLTSNFA